MLIAGGKRLWERDQQLGAAANCLAAAQEGRGGALFLLGEAGLGKTTVLEETCRRAGDDFVVVTARCDPMEAALPFGVLSQVVHGLGGGDDLWTPSAQHEDDARTVTLYRTLRWLEEVARRPILITFDDLQWADPDSLGILGFLCRRLSRLPVAVIASLRPWPADAADLAWSLVHRGVAGIEHLAPLTEEAAARLLAERTGQPISTGVAERAWRLCGGNPLFLGLAARALVSERADSADAEVLPLSVVERSLVLTRFASLSPDGLRWTQAAAVLGIEFRPELVSEVAGLEGDATDVAAEAAWRSGFLRSSKNGASQFIHPLFGQLLYEDIAPPTRALLHARAFTALTARGMDDVAAEHAIRANLAGDAKAIQVVAEAGRRALRAGAPATAANRLQAAVELSGGAAGPPLLTALAEALLEAGRPADAASKIEQMLGTQVPPAQQVAALTTLSRADIAMGHFDRADAALQSAVALAEQESPEAAAVALTRHVDAVEMMDGPAPALALAVRAGSLAKGGSSRLQSQVAAKCGALTFFCGDPSGLITVVSEGRRLLDASRAEVAEDILVSGCCGVLVPFARAAAAAEHFGEAEAAFRAGIDEAERAGGVTAAAALSIPYSLMLVRTKLADSLDVVDRLLAVADLVPLAEPFARMVRSHALLELGEDEASITEWESARAGAATFAIWYCLLWLDHVQGLRLIRHGQFTEASEIYAELEERYRALGIGEPCIIPWGRHAVVAHARAGRVADAERVVAWLDERASRLPCRWPAAAAAAGTALLALGRGNPTEADEGYRTALELLDNVSLPLERAELGIEHGGMLRRDGRPREARETCKRAAEEAESAGATWLARRALEELAAAGGRRRTRRGSQELTAQEQRIARLAATGASDKDIAAHLVVSVRTVRSHLEHVYAKLGMHSRRELMAMGERLEKLLGPRGENGGRDRRR